LTGRPAGESVAVDQLVQAGTVAVLTNGVIAL
jgi:hypothetical protein